MLIEVPKWFVDDPIGKSMFFKKKAPFTENSVNSIS